MQMLDLNADFEKITKFESGVGIAARYDSVIYDEILGRKMELYSAFATQVNKTYKLYFKFFLSLNRTHLSILNFFSETS